MKKIKHTLIAIITVFLVTVFLPVAGAGRSFNRSDIGVTKVNAATLLASGRWGTCRWTIDSNGVLTISAGTGANTNGNSPWGYYYASQITSVKTDGTVVLPSDSNYMFASCSKLTTLDLSNFDTSQVTRMNSMFSWCSSLTTLDLSNFNTSQVTDMSVMFDGCSKLTSLDLSNFNTSQVTDMNYMFANCSSLTSLDVSKFDTSQVTDMSVMFANCSGLTSLDLSGFDTSKVTDMRSMLAGDYSLTTIKFGSNFVVPSSNNISLFPTPTKTVSGKKSTGRWGLNSEHAAVTYSADELAELGTTKGKLSGTWYAQADPLYTIAFNANGGTGTMANESMVYDQSKALTSNAFTKAHYHFTGWNTKADGTGTKYTNGQSVKNLATTGTVTLYAQWAVDTHYLDLNGMLDGANSGGIGGFGTADVYINGKQVANDVSDYYAEWPYGTSWEVKDIKTATGKTYDGLSSGALSGTIGDANSYCVLKFHTNTYTVTYNANGGTGTMSTSRVVYGSQFVTAQNTFTKTGYQFNGWNEKADGTGTAWGLTSAGVYENGNGAKPWKWTYTKSITLYAQWTPNSYTISFNGNGSTGGSTANEAMTYDTAKALTANGFARTGYTFTGWNTSADGKGTAYADKASVKNLAASGTVTLYAQWKVNQYDVTCEDWFVDASNAHKVKLGSKTKKYNYGSTANGSDWGTDGSASKYYASYVYKSSTSAVVGTSGATVYRYFWAWTDLNIYSATGAQDYNTGTVSLSADGGKTWTDNLANESNTIQPWGATYVIKNLVPKRTYEEYDHCTSNLTYSNGQWSYTPTAAGTVMGLYMRYKTYTLTYNAEGGTSSKASQTAKYASKWGTMATASRTGYTFSGWFDDTTYKTAITADTVCYGNKTAHAKWTNNGYTIHYNGNGNTGGSYTDQAMTYDVAANLNANKFTKAHYHFTGWNTKADGSGTKYTDRQSVKNLASSGTVTLYAQWAIDIHYVDLQAGDISAYGTADVYINGKQVANDVSDYCTKWPYGTKWEIKDIKTKTGITYDSATPGLSGTVGDGDSTINLHFHTNTYQVQFSANGGTGTMANQQFTYGIAQNLTANAFTRAGYTFSGWVCQNKSYTDKQSVSNLTAVDKAVVTMVAQWKANTNTPYKVVHQQEQLNGTYATVETQNLTGTTDSTVKPAVKAYTGFTSPAVQTVTIKGDGGTIVTYKYTRQKHTITRQYRLQNADGSYGTYTRIDSASYKYGATIPAWSRAADTEYNAASIAAYTVGTSDKTLSADVARHSGHLVINANGGSASRTTSVIYYGGADSINPMPTRTGYTLTGLYTEDGNVKVVNADGTSANDGTYSADGKWLLTSDVKVTAHWTPVVYSISYGLNGGAVSGNPTTYTTEQTIVLKNPTRKGYVFTGWTGANGTTPQKNVDLQGISLDQYTESNPLNTGTWRNRRDIFAGNSFDVTVGKKYRVFVTAKRTSGNLPMNGGLWYLSPTSGTSYDGYTGAFTKLADVSNGYAVYYKDIVVPAGKAKALFYIQIDQDAGTGTTAWNLYDMHVYDVDAAVKIATGSTGDKSYTANWRAHTITTKIDINGGTPASDGSDNPKVRSYDEKIGQYGLSDPEHYTSGKTGYHITGIYHVGSANGSITVKRDGQFVGEPVQNYAAYIGYPIEDKDQSVTLYTEWAPNNYAVKFDANNGTGTMANEAMTYDADKLLTANTYTRKGYTFTGWNTKADGTGTKYSDKQSVKNLTAANGGAVTLYAQWKVDTYTITYVLNGGTNDKSNPSAYTVESADITLKDPARTGYAFNGWNEGKTISKGSTGNKTFTAQWKAHKLTLHVDINGGVPSESSAPNPMVIYYDSTKTEDGNDDIAQHGIYNACGNDRYTTGRTGYNHDSGLYHIGSASSFNTVSETQTFANAQTLAKAIGYPIEGKDQEVTLYVDWAANKYTIKFNANNGTGTMSDEAMVYDTARALTANSFKRTGYTFSGWNTQQDGTGKTYSDKQSVSNLTSTNTGTVTLYAKWTINTYTITYNLKGGINSSKNPSTYTVDDAVTLSNPAKDGYAFAGWAEGSQIAKGSTGDKTFTAKWKPIMKVSFTDGTSQIKGASAVIVDAVTGNTVDSWTTDGTVHSFNAEPSHAYTIRMSSADHYYATATVMTPAETDTKKMDDVVLTASKLPALPNTGGTGTILIIIIACVCLIISIAMHDRADK